MRRAMMIDLDKCIGCQACVTSCKERWDSGPNAHRDWVNEYENVDGENIIGITFYPGLCMQCEEHPCTTDCPTGATYMDKKTGVVMVDSDVCIGCGNCVSMCSYDARHLDEKKGIVEKCNLCAPYVERGEQPACVATCLSNCRHFGDLDDPTGELVALIEKTRAKPLVTEAIDIGPRVTYAGETHRKQIVARGVVKKGKKSQLTTLWAGVTRPFVTYFVPTIMGATLLGGLFVNLKNRKNKIAGQNTKDDSQKTLSRHRAGMRFLHWFNLLSWLLLLATGVALMSSPSFALFGERFPKLVAGAAGGGAPLIKFHVVWGIAWAVIIIPIFLVYKRWGLEALQELRLTRDDIAWLRHKPSHMLGLSKKPLPDQDKYNAGQKLFAMAVLGGTIAIIATGLVMSFHLGPPQVIAACIVLHKLAVAVTLLGVAVHFTMAAVLKDERPALKSMISGNIDYEHANHHNRKWVKEMDTLAMEGKK